MIMIFGKLVLNDDISRHFLNYFEIFIFKAVRGWGWGKRANMPEIKNNNCIHHAPYLRNSVAYDHDF